MKKKIFIGIFIVAVLGLAALGIFVYHKMQPQPEQIQQPMLNAPIEIPAEGIVKYQEVTNFEKPVLALFYVDWCTYCRRFMPIFGAIAKEYNDKYTFAVINCDYPENMSLNKEYNIMAFPTLFIIDNKYEYSTMVNQYSVSDIKLVKKELDKYLKLRSRIKE